MLWSSERSSCALKSTDQLEISSWVPGACTGEPRLQCEIQRKSIVKLMSRNDLGYQDAQKELVIEE